MCVSLRPHELATGGENKYIDSSLGYKPNGGKISLAVMYAVVERLSALRVRGGHRKNSPLRSNSSSTSVISTYPLPERQSTTKGMQLLIAVQQQRSFDRLIASPVNTKAPTVDEKPARKELKGNDPTSMQYTNCAIKTRRASGHMSDRVAEPGKLRKSAAGEDVLENAHVFCKSNVFVGSFRKCPEFLARLWVYLFKRQRILTEERLPKPSIEKNITRGGKRSCNAKFRLGSRPAGKTYKIKTTVFAVACFGCACGGLVLSLRKRDTFSTLVLLPVQHKRKTLISSVTTSGCLWVIIWVVGEINQ